MRQITGTDKRMHTTGAYSRKQTAGYRHQKTDIRDRQQGQTAWMDSRIQTTGTYKRIQTTETDNIIDKNGQQEDTDNRADKRGRQ